MKMKNIILSLGPVLIIAALLFGSCSDEFISENTDGFNEGDGTILMAPLGDMYEL